MFSLESERIFGFGSVKRNTYITNNEIFYKKYEETIKHQILGFKFIWIEKSNIFLIRIVNPH